MIHSERNKNSSYPAGDLAQKEGHSRRTSGEEEMNKESRVRDYSLNGPSTVSIDTHMHMLIVAQSTLAADLHRNYCGRRQRSLLEMRPQEIQPSPVYKQTNSRLEA